MSEARAASGAPGDGDAASAVSAGALLRAARERQGVHLAVLAASLKVAPRKIELVESGRYDELPDASFARALALSMCRALKIDAEPVLSRLPQARGERLEPLTRMLNQPFREHDGRPGSPARRGALSLPVVAAGLLVLAALIVYLLPGRGWNSAEVAELTPPPGAVPAPGAGATPPPDALAGADPAGTPSLSAAASAAGAAASSVVVDTVFLEPPPGQASAPVSPAGDGLLTLRATTRAAWVEVRDANNQVLLSRTLAAGESANVDGAVPLRVRLGNVAATQLSFRGEPVTLKATRENIVRLELK